VKYLFDRCNLQFSQKQNIILYTGTILLANYGLGKKTIWQITLAAIALTIFNLFFPNLKPHSSATIANRLITVMTLAVTGW
jgi:two-component system NarL family sensor kinase